MENAHEDWGLPCSTAPPVPRSTQGSKVRPLARAAQGASRYCLSFTAAGLRADLAAVIAGIYLEEGDWMRTKAAVLERNALQARSANSGKRLELELRQRLQQLSASQLELLAQGSSEERCAMAWLAALKRIPIAQELTQTLLTEKLDGRDPVLRRSDMAAFYEVCEREHPELGALAPSSTQKVRSALLQMIRDAGLLLGKAGKGGTLGTVQRPLLSPQVQELLMQDDPALLSGFLQAPVMGSSRRKQSATHRQSATTDQPSAKPKPKAQSKAAQQAKATPKAKPKAARQPIAKAAGASRRASA